MINSSRSIFAVNALKLKIRVLNVAGLFRLEKRFLKTPFSALQARACSSFSKFYLLRWPAKHRDAQ